MNPQTRRDLLEAMHGEAFAYASYMLFAEQAELEGEPEAAELLRETARVELHEHFAELADLVGLAGRTVDNLRTAVAGESHEIETTYRHFIRDAEEAGETAAVERLSEIREDEIGHRTVFQDALARLEQAAARETGSSE